MRTLVLFGRRIRVERLLELVKYTSGCGCSVLVKMLVTMIFSLCHAPVWMAYLGAQVVIVFFSYGFHSRITFREERYSWYTFWLFFRSLLLFKLLDYFLVVLGAKMLTRWLERDGSLTLWQQQGVVSGSILVVSMLIFFARYTMYRSIFRRRKRERIDFSDSSGQKF